MVMKRKTLIYISIIILSIFVLIVLLVYILSNEKKETVLKSNTANSYTSAPGVNLWDIKSKTGSYLSPTGAYRDGIYSGFGSLNSGALIVQITISSGKLTNIVIEKFPGNTNLSTFAPLINYAIDNQVAVVPENIIQNNNYTIVFNDALNLAVSKSFKV